MLNVIMLGVILLNLVAPLPFYALKALTAAFFIFLSSAFQSGKAETRFQL
jgi:hypothetical protein